MTQEDKQLLLKDLCARLPYVTQIHITSDECDDGFQSGEFDNTLRYHHIEAFVCDRIEIKPYLRPMSNMTEDEKLEIKSYLCSIEGQLIGDNGRHIWYFDYLKEHHFDFRKLIEKGLALEAREGMYE